LFTEFANRNKVVIDLNRKERQEARKASNSPMSLSPSNKLVQSLKIGLNSSPKESLIEKANQVIEKNHLVKIRDTLARSMTLNKNQL
jgi:hypothetical protein